jgi:lipoyl synthase
VNGDVRLPDWLTRRLSDPARTRAVRTTLATHALTTVCEEARCPNRSECFARGTATFMILGDRCTRDCRFCAVRHGKALPLDPDEPENVAAAAADLGLGHVVVTSVTRDDLPDGGARQFAETVAALRRKLPGAGVEVLTPDFAGNARDIDTVTASEPDVFAHNVETVERLYKTVRKGADYSRSLNVLARASKSRPRPIVKSSLMLGVGESSEEIEGALGDMLSAGVDILTLGQYLRPSAAHHAVARFVTPAEFDELARASREMGFKWVSAAPFVRSSYRAEEAATALMRSRFFNKQMQQRRRAE